MKKVIIVSGPTASGKTDLALELAKKVNGELISADSRQIYKYLRVGTNTGDINLITNYKLKVRAHSNNLKDQVKLPLYSLDNIPIHMVSFLDLDKRFNAFEFNVYAEAIIEDIFSRGKQPIVVGGTGLYIDILTGKLDLDSPPPNQKLRDRLNNKSVEELQKVLIFEFNFDLENLNESDRQNPRRLIRKIEKLDFVETGEKKFFSDKQEKYMFEYYSPKYDWDVLKKKIEQRVEHMFSAENKESIITETKEILKMGYEPSCPALQIMGYKEVVNFLQGKNSLEETIEKVKIAHRQYARRQRTWFGKR